jgi:hypothetical protein
LPRPVNCILLIENDLGMWQVWGASACSWLFQELPHTSELLKWQVCTMYYLTTKFHLKILINLCSTAYSSQHCVAQFLLANLSGYLFVLIPTIILGMYMIPSVLHYNTPNSVTCPHLFLRMSLLHYCFSLLGHGPCFTLTFFLCGCDIILYILIFPILQTVLDLKYG